MIGIILLPPGLTWHACSKKREVKLELLNDVNMLLLVERDVRGGMYHAIHWYARANNKYEKDFDPKKESSYLMY